MSFLDNRHPVWKEKNKRWDYTWDNYTGEYAKHDRVELYQKKSNKRLNSDKYLQRKVQAETEEAYFERIATTDPILLFPTAVDSINGISYGKEDETVRDWGDLGDPEEDGTISSKLWHDADGSGTNWVPLMKQMGIKQTVLHRVWGMVDGIKETVFETDGEEQSEVIGEATVHIIDPQSVVDWFPNHNPTQVLIKESSDLRTSILDTDTDREADTYILYELEGWTRYIDNEGSPEIIGQGMYDFWVDNERTQRMLPIFPVEVPIPREVGYLLSIKQNHIYNAKSIRDFSVRNMSFATLVLSATDAQYNDFIDNIKKGYRVIRQEPDSSGDHRYIAPPSDYLAEAGEILENNKKDFMESAFKSYGDAARQVTATEIRQESRSGVEAFLNLLITSLDEFENKCLWLLEQVYFPNETGRWGKAFVKRSDDFTPKDVEAAMEQTSATILNADRAKAMSTHQKVKQLHPGWEKEEIEEEVKRIREEQGAVEVPGNMVGG